MREKEWKGTRLPSPSILKVFPFLESERKDHTRSGKRPMIWGHPFKRHLSREKSIPWVRKSIILELPFFLSEEICERCGCENGPPNGSSEQPPSFMIFSDLFIPIRLLCISFPTRYLEVSGAFLPNMISGWSHQPLSLCRSFFGFVGVRLDGTSHPSGSRSTGKAVLLCDPCPISRDPENLRFQAVSK